MISRKKILISNADPIGPIGMTSEKRSETSGRTVSGWVKRPVAQKVGEAAKRYRGTTPSKVMAEILTAWAEGRPAKYRPPVRS